MTAEQQNLVHDLANGRITREVFLSKYPTTESGRELSTRLLKTGFLEKNASDVQFALAIGFVFGVSPSQAETLRHLIGADWHTAHEDVVSALDELRDGGAVEALFEATQMVPEYLEFDDARALAVKAIWALGNIGNATAREKLKIIADSNDEILQRNALKQLDRIGS